MDILKASDLIHYYLYLEVDNLDFEVEQTSDSDRENFFCLMSSHEYEVTYNSICIFL